MAIDSKCSPSNTKVTIDWKCSPSNPRPSHSVNILLFPITVLLFKVDPKLKKKWNRLFIIDSLANHTNKPHRERTTFTENHLKVLERCFNEIKHPDTSLREKIATQLGLPIKTIQVWFQNRRARERKGGKEKKFSDGGVKDWQNFSGMEKDYYPTLKCLFQKWFFALFHIKEV